MSIWTEPAPRQPGLDRERIVATAIEIADESGATAVTMKAVGDRLGVTAMALYRHVGNKDGLVDLMLDTTTAEVGLAPGEWEPALRALAWGTREMLKRHPWHAELVHTRPPAGPHQMRRLDFILSVLTAAGTSLPDAMTYAAMVFQHVFGSALQESTEARFNTADDPTAHYAVFVDMRERAAGEMPALFEWLSAPSGPSADERFELVLGFLLDGIASRL